MRLLLGLTTASALLAASPLLAGERTSPDRRFLWNEGAAFITVIRPGSRKSRTVRLPPPPGKGWARRLLFAERGDFFCVLDEETRELGLHLDAPRGASAAKAMVVASTLRLLDARGKVRWTRRMRDNHIVGSRDGAPALRLAPAGTLAMLLQDADPYTKTHPLLLVMDRENKELLRLDYTSWSRIDEFALSDDGAALAVRGVGRIPDEETWGKAFAYYMTGDRRRWIHGVRGASSGRHLRGFDRAGWACCLKQGASFLAFGSKGRVRTLEPDEAARFPVEGP